MPRLSFHDQRISLDIDRKLGTDLKMGPVAKGLGKQNLAIG
jgi:hypothetical protein